MPVPLGLIPRRCARSLKLPAEAWNLALTHDIGRWDLPEAFRPFLDIVARHERVEGVHGEGQCARWDFLIGGIGHRRAQMIAGSVCQHGCGGVDRQHGARLCFLCFFGFGMWRRCI